MMEESKWANRLRSRSMIEKSCRSMIYKQDSRIAFMQRNLNKCVNKVTLMYNDIQTIDYDIDTVAHNTQLLNTRIIILQNLMFIQFVLSCFIFTKHYNPSIFDNIYSTNFSSIYDYLSSIFINLKNKYEL